MVNITPFRHRGSNGGEAGSGLVRLRNQMDRLFDRFLDMPFGLSSSEVAGSDAWSPLLEVSDNEKEVVVRAEVPGIEPDDINITVRGNELVISGTKKESTEDHREGYHVSERRYGSFYRAIELPAEIDPDKVTADYNNGVLELHVPKSPQQVPKRIPVHARSGQAGQGPSQPQQRQQQGESRPSQAQRIQPSQPPPSSPRRNEAD
ncbi:MAG: Hsp20/alpha crystallin family protein [Phycisphaerales bacterium]|nr:Hsp20/alpha crystallin family protein [Phycisphaerales bacterium]MCI0631279.1 Hsp20/alpha crystallin family protein [Phycisphaerales bacterium]MCI0676350.1 Hsp20/alpha crystallin family protein [Phycisphaerales bacterium]